MDLPINEALRQHISLSTFAYNTIMSDLMTYDETISKSGTLSGIANVIIQNYFDRSFASVSQNAENEKLELDTLILQNFKLESKEAEIANKLRDSLVIKHREDLALRMNGFSKDHNVKIRLQKETARLLENECSEDITYYTKSLTGYLKALLEDYARQNQYTRETILFRRNIEKLETEINTAEYLGGKSRAIKLSCTNYYNTEINEYICKPYRITQEDEIDEHAYLLCLCIDPKDPDDGYVEALLPVLEILNIEYAPKKYGSANLTKENKKKMDQLVSEHNSFLFGRRKEPILVSMTEQGLYDFYHRSSKDRPTLDIKKIRKNGNHRYDVYFYCTQKQARDYFLQFGGEAVILLPKELSDKMAAYYHEANYLYSLHSDKQAAPKPNKEVEQDIELLKEADKKGYFVKTWNELALKYYKKCINLQDVESDFLFYQMAADLEYDIAYPSLADLYFENDFFKKDYAKAAFYYEKGYDQLDNFEKANYASLMINNLVPGHTPKEGEKILEEIKDRFHKEHISWPTPEGYKFYSYEYKRYDHPSHGFFFYDGDLFDGDDAEWDEICGDDEDN